MVTIKHNAGELNLKRMGKDGLRLFAKGVDLDIIRMPRTRLWTVTSEERALLGGADGRPSTTGPQKQTLRKLAAELEFTPALEFALEYAGVRDDEERQAIVNQLTGS